MGINPKIKYKRKTKSFIKNFILSGSVNIFEFFPGCFKALS